MHIYIYIEIDIYKQSSIYTYLSIHIYIFFFLGPYNGAILMGWNETAPATGW